MKKIGVPTLHKSLNSQGYICDVPFAVSVGSAIHAKPVGGAFLYGPAGTGKSYLPQVLSHILKRELFFHQCSPGTREEDVLLSIMPDENTISGVKETQGKVLQAAITSRKKKVVLVLDEWDKTRPSADGFLLDFLQYGRLSLKGKDVEANLDNMLIFFTANDERDFQEALLRRFPKIDIDPLHPEVVHQALKITHDGNGHIVNCINLYVKCLMSGMNKPATIQELRQLMDAIQYLGGGADWNSLVYQFVTKTPESHALLSSVESKDIGEFITKMNQSRSQSLSHESYESNVLDDVLLSKNYNPKMPRLAEMRKQEKGSVVPLKLKVKPADIYGIFDRSPRSYTNIVNMTDELPSESNDFGWAKIVNGKTILLEPFTMHNIHKLIHLSRKEMNGGEIMVQFEDVEMIDVRRLIRLTSMITVEHITNTDAVFKYQYKDQKSGYVVDCRFTEKSGLEMIIPVREQISHPLDIIHKMLQKPNSRPLYHYDYFDGYDGANYELTVARLGRHSDIDEDFKLGLIGLKYLRHCDFIGMMKVGYKSDHKIIDDMSKDASKIYYDGFTGAMRLCANNIEIDTGSHKNNYIMTVKIYGLLGQPGKKMLRKSLGFDDVSLAVYECFKVDANDVIRKMKRNGWSIGNGYAVRNGITCLFLNDYFLFYARVYIEHDINSRILALRNLKRHYEAN